MKLASIFLFTQLAAAQIASVTVGPQLNYSNQQGGINGWANTGRYSHHDTTRSTWCLDNQSYVSGNDGFGPQYVLGVGAGRAVFLTTMSDFLAPGIGALQTLVNSMDTFGNSAQDIFGNQTSMKSAGLDCQWDAGLGLEMMYWSVYQQWSGNDPRHGYHVNLMMSRDHGATWYGPYHTNHSTGAPTITPSATGDGPGVNDQQFDDTIKSIYPMQYCQGGKNCPVVDGNDVYKYGYAESELAEHLWIWRVLLSDYKKGDGSLYQWYKGTDPVNDFQLTGSWDVSANKAAREPAEESGTVVIVSPPLYLPALHRYVMAIGGAHNSFYQAPTLAGPWTRIYDFPPIDEGWQAPILKSMATNGNIVTVTYFTTMGPGEQLVGDPNNRYGPLFHQVTFYGGISGVQVTGVTNTQAVLQFNAPDSTACTIEVSESPTFSPLVNDVNPAMFTNANLDLSRSSTVVNGHTRTVVIGRRTAEHALDGWVRSRALQQNTATYYRACGSNGVTGSFSTAPVPLGSTFPDTIPADPSDPEHPLWPQIDWRDRNWTAIDPHTGVLLKQLSFPGEASSGPFNPLPFQYSYGPAWTNATSGNATSGAGASINGSTSPLTLSIVNCPTCYFSAISVSISCAIDGGATGNDAMGQIAISRNGTTPYAPTGASAWHDFTCPSTIAPIADVGDSVAFNTAGSSGYMPFWTDAANGGRPIKFPISPGQIAVSVSGSQISNGSTSQAGFNPFTAPGQLIYVNNSGTMNPFVISSIQNFHAVTVTGTPTGTAVDVPSLYFLVRKKTATANTMNFRAQYNVIFEDPIQMNGSSGGIEQCAPRGVPDGMYISAISAGGVVTFAQPTHGFTIGSSVAITIGGTTPTSVDGNYTANIVDNAHATINSWSTGAWSGDGYMFQPGAKIGYLCWILTNNGASMMQNIFQDGEVRNLGALYLGNADIGTVSTNALTDIIKNPYLGYLRSFNIGIRNGVLAATYWPRTRDVGQGIGGYVPTWHTIATNIYDSIFAFDSRMPQPLSHTFLAGATTGNFTHNLNFLPLVRCVDTGGNQLSDGAIGKVLTGTTSSFTFSPALPTDTVCKFSFGLGPLGLLKQNNLLMSGTYDTQDSLSWTVVLDGSGIPIASDSAFSQRPDRFAGSHGSGDGASLRNEQLVIRSYHSSGHYATTSPFNGAWTFTLQSTMSGKPYSDCATLAPGNILTAAPFPASGLHCSLITVSSTTPTDLSTPAETLHGPLQTGDIINAQGENLRVVTVPDSTHLVVQRGFSADHYNATSCADPVVAQPGACSWSHSIGTVFEMAPGEMDFTTIVYNSGASGLSWWNYPADALGSNAGDPAAQGLSTATKYLESAFPTASHFDWKDHIFVNDVGGDQSDPTTPNAIPNNGKVDGVRLCAGVNQRSGCQPVFITNANPAFSGVTGAAFGNYGDQHPSIVSPDPALFANHPITGLPAFPFYLDFQTTGVVSDGVTHIADLVAGTTQIYKFTTGDSADIKRSAAFVTSGPYTLAEVSAPARVLNDNSSDFYKFCQVGIAGECWTGSTVGEIYANVPYAITINPDSSHLGCYLPNVLDVCAWKLGAHQGKWTQLGMQRQDRLGSESRATTGGLQTLRRNGGNTRVTPDGNWQMILADAGAVSTTMFLAKIGAFPPYSSVNRTDFIPWPVPITARAGATTAVEDYGFDENFHCTSRNDTCVANGNATSDPNPFYWASETYAGAPCTSGCKINIPAISGRTVYYRTRWLSGGSTVATGKTLVVAVP
jgi:hypothetical protein